MNQKKTIIPDRTRPGLTTPAIGVAKQDTDGKYATAGVRRKKRRGGKRVRRKREARRKMCMELRAGTLNVGTMTGKGRELADMMQRRKVDILCVQETRWKGSKARNIGGGYKLYYHGVDGKRNGVGIVLREELTESVLEVKRVSDRVMGIRLGIGGVILNVLCAYAPQVGCEQEEKERFWQDMDELLDGVPRVDKVVLGADLNGHVGEGNRGDEEMMGRYGYGLRNEEGQRVVDFAKSAELAVVNTYYKKKEEHRITYKSGGRRTQVDYILCRRRDVKEVVDCKVVVGESVATQHRMVLCKLVLQGAQKKRIVAMEPRVRWWKLNEVPCREQFNEEVRKGLQGAEEFPEDWESTAKLLRESGEKVLGMTSGKRKNGKETWWWNMEVQDSIKEKREAKKVWDMRQDEESKKQYKETRKKASKAVQTAKQEVYRELYERLETREGEKELYRLAKQRERAGRDIQQVRVIKDAEGKVLTGEGEICERWKEYFERLMNEENERVRRTVEAEMVTEEVEEIKEQEVWAALRKMKGGKAVGPDNLPVEVWKTLGDTGVKFLTRLFNQLLEGKRMPDEWRTSTLVPIFKNKGDIQCCGNYRGIKLMSHTMKLWERVVERRLRAVVEICEQQYGFMPGKSTADAIFALRMLMEKYREGQSELHCVFVDLEKAYDRVPREEMWYCLTESGVPERYVSVIKDMYDGSMTAVKSVVGMSECFEVGVGLHQGSALSPFLFAMLMDRLTDEVRQESPWNMMFADDIVICERSREQAETSLERWRDALEKRGMKVSRAKTEYMCLSVNDDGGTIRMQGRELVRVKEFKYLGSTVQDDGECWREVKKRVQAGWNGWKKVSGVICDRKLSAKLKGRIYNTAVRPAVLYGLETVALTRKQEVELEVAELRMLRFALGVTRLDKIRNEYIRGTAKVERLGSKVRESRLRWYGHVMRRNDEYVGRRVMEMELPGKRRRGRPKRRFMDVVGEDMRELGVTGDDVRDRARWRRVIRCGDPDEGDAER